MPSRRGFPFAKIVTVLAIALGVEIGLCGLNFLLLGFGIGRGAPNQEFNLGGPALSVLGVIEFVAMLITGPLLVIAVIAWVIAEIIGRPGGSRPQKLFDTGEDKPRDDDRGQH